MSRQKIETITIEVPVNGTIVQQKLTVEDWTITTSVAIDGRTVFPLRHLRPDTSVLATLVESLLENSQDPKARRVLGTHLLGTYLAPEAVLETKILSGRDLERAYDGGAARSRRRFEDHVDEGARKKGADTDLERALVKALIGRGETIGSAHAAMARFDEGDLIEEVIAQHSLAYRRCRAAGLDYSPFDRHSLEKAEAHRIRAMLRRRLGGDSMRQAAFWYSCAGEVLVHEANQLTLAALRPQISNEECRAFEFFYLRRTPRGPGLGFDGIVGYRPYLIGLLRLSPQTLGQLIATGFYRVQDPHQRAELHEGLRRRIVGLLDAGAYVATRIREDDVENIRSRRDRTRSVSPTKARRSVTGATAAEIGQLRALAGPDGLDVESVLSALTPRQREVVEELATGKTVTEVAEALGISYQAVQNARMRGLERARSALAPARKGRTPHGAVACASSG